MRWSSDSVASQSVRIEIGALRPVSVCNAYSISIRLETMWPLYSAANALDIRLGGLEERGVRNRCASTSIRMQCILHQYSIGNEVDTGQCSKCTGHKTRWPRNRCATESVRLDQYPHAMHTPSVSEWKRGGH